MKGFYIERNEINAITEVLQRSVTVYNNYYKSDGLIDNSNWPT